MTLNKDIFLRSHVVEVDPKEPLVSDYNEPKWPEYVLMFDTETTLDPKEQSLLFGFYRIGRLQDKVYRCIEEGIFHADDLASEHKEVISRYVQTVSSEVVHDDYDERIHVYSRSDFIEKIFFYAIRLKSLIVAFNAPWDISRLAVGHRVSRNRGWTLILSQRISRKTGELEPNPERPCMRVTSKDSKAAFFSLTKPVRPEEWPTYKVGTKTRLICRVLDLRTLSWALFNEQHSLKSACKALGTDHQKFDHEPSGTISNEEIDYARQDVRCSVDLLNALKEEFDLHPIRLHPDKGDKAVSRDQSVLRIFFASDAPTRSPESNSRRRQSEEKG